MRFGESHFPYGSSSRLQDYSRISWSTFQPRDDSNTLGFYLDVDIESLGIELDQIPNQSSISIELQYQIHYLGVDGISTWNFMR
jgi:hypothetical protein